MAAVQHYGLQSQRSGTGALLSSELERIRGFLRFGGVLLATGLGGWLAVLRPKISEMDDSLLNAHPRRVLVSASLEGLRQLVDLTAGEVRVLEVLTPGPLILAKENGNPSEETLMTVPDDGDLRDLALVFGGTTTVFLFDNIRGPAEFEALLNRDSTRGSTLRPFGILNPFKGRPRVEALSTIVRIEGPGMVECLVEGALKLDEIRAASNAISQWEIGEWT